jgi:IS5 family transposase
MRSVIHRQLPLVEPTIEHQHAEELKKMDTLIEQCPQIASLVYQDLIAGLRDPQSGRKGRMTADQAFRVLLIKQMNGFSYNELTFHLADSRCYRHFCSFGIADKIPSKSVLQNDLKRIRPETLEQVNRLLVTLAMDCGIENGRKVRVDCTVSETNIHTPSDSSLLEDCVRVLTRLLLQAQETLGDIPVSNHHRRAKRRAMEILNANRKAKMRKPYRDLLKVTSKTVGYAKAAVDMLKTRSYETIEAMLLGMGFVEELEHYIPLAEQVICQTQRRVFNGESLSPQDKIVSIFEPHTDIIRKDRRDTYYGHKLALSGGDSGIITDLVICDGNPADSTLAVEMASRQKQIFHRAPRQIAYDGAFASRANLSEIKELGVKDVAFSKKCGLKVSDMVKSSWVYKRLRDFRAGIEGIISYLKRCFGLGRCNWRGLASFKAYAWSSVVTANLLLMARHLIQ